MQNYILRTDQGRAKTTARLAGLAVGYCGISISCLFLQCSHQVNMKTFLNVEKTIFDF